MKRIFVILLCCFFMMAFWGGNYKPKKIIEYKTPVEFIGYSEVNNNFYILFWSLEEKAKLIFKYQKNTFKNVSQLDIKNNVEGGILTQEEADSVTKNVINLFKKNISPIFLNDNIYLAYKDASMSGSMNAYEFIFSDTSKLLSTKDSNLEVMADYYIGISDNKTRVFFPARNRGNKETWLRTSIYEYNSNSNKIEMFAHLDKKDDNSSLDAPYVIPTTGYVVYVDLRDSGIKGLAVYLKKIK